MKKLYSILFIVILISSAFVVSIEASSSGDDDDSSTGGGGGGGAAGGSPDFFDYYVPLVFGPDHPDGYSEVTIWLPTGSALITTFGQNDFGSNVMQYREPTKLTFNPKDHPELTNGSLIRTTTPAQVVGQRVNEDISSDQSFAYSILPRRMMGFEYYAPFDGTVTMLSLNQQTEIRVANPDGTSTTSTIQLPADTITVPVQQGSYINSSFPTIGVFYTTGEGMSASMAVPRYLHGSSYYFDGDVLAQREKEIDQSYLTITPSEPTPLNITYSDGSLSQYNIFGTTKLELDESMRSISAARGTLEANIRLKVAYGGLVRTSTVQMMAIEEMRAGEIFMTPKGYSTHFSVGTPETEFNFTHYNFDNQDYEVISRLNELVDEKEAFSVSSVDDTQFLMATDYMFAFSSSPGHTSHPMAPSVSFVNIPVNRATQNDFSGLNATWYRFANLAITNVEIIPGPLEEYTGQLIRIEVTANGSLPASQFSVIIEIDEEVEVEETYDFLQVNETLVYDIRKFLPLGKKKLNITIDVDPEDQVNELNEDDNFIEEGYEVRINIRLRFTVFAILVGIIGYGGYRFRTWLKTRRTVKRAHVDAILTFEEEEP